MNFEISDIAMLKFETATPNIHVMTFKTNSTIKTMNNSTNTGDITNYPGAHLLQTTFIYPTYYEELYKPVNSKAKKI